MSRLNSLIEMAKQKGSKRAVVAGSEESDILQAVEAGRKYGIVEVILVGNKEATKVIADKLGIDLANYTFIEEPNPKKQASVAVEQITSGKADVLVKGLVATADYMRAILNKQNGLMTGKLLSHVAVFDIPAYHKLLTLTDAAVVIAPGVKEKVTLIQNAVLAAQSVGIETPKVACVCAVEKVNPGAMKCTEDAALLSMMQKRGQISGCIVDGPFGFDNAVSKHSAEVKKITGEVAGDADILIADDIESANAMYKSFNCFANASCAAIVLGAKAPVVLTSRADDDKTKLASLTLGVLIAHKM